MSDQYQPGPQQGSSSSTDVVTALQGIIRQITAGNAQLKSVDTDISTAIDDQTAAVAAAIAALTAAVLAVFPARIFTGSFTCGAAVSTVVANGNVLTTSIILCFPTNAAAGTLIGSAKSLYISSKSVGVSFTVATASGVAAAGTETFSYIIVNP